MRTFLILINFLYSFYNINFRFQHHCHAELIKLKNRVKSKLRISKSTEQWEVLSNYFYFILYKFLYLSFYLQTASSVGYEKIIFNWTVLITESFSIFIVMFLILLVNKLYFSNMLLIFISIWHKNRLNFLEIEQLLQFVSKCIH